MVDTGTIQLEECQLPAARVQEHRLGLLGVPQVKIYLVILPDTFYGDINIVIIKDAKIGLGGLTKFSLLTKRVLLRTRSSLQSIQHKLYV